MVSTVASLADRDAREQWENSFNQNYIQPVLQVYIRTSTTGMTCWTTDMLILCDLGSCLHLHNFVFPHPMRDSPHSVSFMMFSLLLKELDQRVTEAMDSILSDDQQGAVYWKYRSVPLIHPLRKYPPPLFTAKVPAQGSLTCYNVPGERLLEYVNYTCSVTVQVRWV